MNANPSVTAKKKTNAACFLSFQNKMLSAAAEMSQARSKNKTCTCPCLHVKMRKKYNYIEINQQLNFGSFNTQKQTGSIKQLKPGEELFEAFLPN